MQPLRTKIKKKLSEQKKSLNPSDPKNHATSRDKNHTTSWDKQKSCNLSRQKITLSIGPIASKLVHKALNCSKWHQICPNRSRLESKWLGPNGSKLFKKGLNVSKWDNLVQMGSNWSIGIQNWGPKLS